MRMPRPWLWSLALTLGACRASESTPAPADAFDPTAVPACHQAVARGLQPIHLDAVAVVVKLLASNDVVLLGEHHSDVAEIDFLVSVIDALDRPTVLAMELLPRAAQADINQALVAETLSEEAWPGIVGAKYWPAPLHVAEYSRILDAVRAARQRGIDVQISGLAPQCTLPSNPRRADRERAIRCFKERDDRMLDRLRHVHVDLPKHAILVSAGWRHVSATRLPGAPRAMGMDLPAHWSAQRLLLAGTEQTLADGTVRATCAGAPAAIAEVVGKPVFLPSEPTPWTLSDCVDTGEPVTRRFAGSFDGVIGLLAAPAPTPWDRYAFARVPAEDRTTWSRTRNSLMNEPWPSGSPEELERWASQDIAAVAAQQARRTVGCPP